MARPIRPVLHRASPSSLLRSSPTRTPSTTRPLHSRVAPAPVPSPTPFVPTPHAFLTLIGRSLSAHAAKIPSWPALFTLTSTQLRDLGVEPARSRKYLLRWRDKFRRGEWGVGGDCAHVDAEGRAEVRVVDVDVGSEVEGRAWRRLYGDGVRRAREGEGDATVTRSAGTRRIVVNVPVEAAFKPSPAATDAAAADAEAAAPAEAEVAEGEAKESTEGDAAAQPAAAVFKPLSPAQLAKSHPIVSGIKFAGAKGLVGSHIEPIKGTSGQAAIIRVKEGLWEDIRGHKIDGGERRKAEVRAKRRAAERRAGVR